MRNNIKALRLVEKGLSSKTVSKLTESQIDSLYNKLVIEQVTQVPSKPAFKVGPKGGVLPPNAKGYSVRQDPSTKEVIATASEEVTEDLEDPMDFEKGSRSQAPHQVGPSTDDGFGDYDDGTEEFNEVKKKKKSNPWAICTAQLSSEFGTPHRSQWSAKEKNKYERCVKDVKKTLEEEKLMKEHSENIMKILNVHRSSKGSSSLNNSNKDVSLFLENAISRIVEKHLQPKITKRDLMKYLYEASAAPAVAPTKPTTKPSVKPGTNPRPSHPGKNPFPGEHPSPKAKLPSPEEAKEKVIDVILNLIKKN